MMLVLCPGSMQGLRRSVAQPLSLTLLSQVQRLCCAEAIKQSPGVVLLCQLCPLTSCRSDACANNGGLDAFSAVRTLFTGISQV